MSVLFFMNIKGIVHENMSKTVCTNPRPLASATHVRGKPDKFTRFLQENQAKNNHSLCWFT